ncbi:Zinc finger RING-type protein-like protein [Dinothrombium tinctorium]|uniref:Zinc finger RING-type protein-like protein n=1 Tax=Dinothrombium tinctorium TaxID=1965070 RepID=A0A443Q9C1_9ACAR|nr:Zinc finger RING-type protein-like protein [Dinothrombium tinctorium]
MENQSRICSNTSTDAEEEEHSAILQKKYEEVKRNLMKISQEKSKMEEIYKTSRRKRDEENKELVREIKSKNNAVESALLCKICYDKMVHPYTLTCQHTFCAGCLSKLPRNKENNRLCPFCSKPFRLPQTVTEYNYVIEDIKSIFG